MTLTAPEFFRAKAQLTTELRTRELDRLPLEIRERSFFMAAVSEAEILQVFRDASDDVLNGKINKARAREIVRERLAGLGYAPRPGEAGTIKDLRSANRINVAIDTNVTMANNHAFHVKQLRARRAFPGQRMVRLARRREPRDWPLRFGLAAGQLTPADRAATNVGELAAPIDSPIWPLLSRFGTPYPPFDFNSGMGVQALGRAQSRELGILPVDAPPATPPPEPSLNETLEATPKVTEQDLRNGVSARLQGFAEWEGDTLRFTDPNGTRPYAAPDLARVLSAPLPEGFPRLQLRAALTFSETPADLRRGLNITQDFARLVERTTTHKDPAETLYHALPFRLARSMMGAADFGLGEIFSAFEPGLADAFGRVSGQAVVLELVGRSQVRDLRPLYSALRRPTLPAVIATETQRFRVQATRRGTVDGRPTLIVTIEEVLP